MTDAYLTPLPEIWQDMTPREKELVMFLSQNLSIKEIARASGRAEGTLKVQKFTLFKRLGVHTRGEMLCKLMGLGPLELSADAQLPLMRVHNVEVKL